MKASSISPSRIATCSSPLASAASVPGASCRCRSAALAVAVRRGSDDDQPAAPAALLVEVLHDRRHGVGRVAAGDQDRLGLGDVGERKRQAAVEPEGHVRRPPPPRPCRSARCSRCAGCRARRARTCRAGTPSRWSARRRRRPRPRRGRARPGRSGSPAITRSSASSQVAGRSAPPLASRTSGVVSRPGAVRRLARRSSPCGTSPRGWSGKSRAITSRLRRKVERHPALQGAIRAMGSRFTRHLRARSALRGTRRRRPRPPRRRSPACHHACEARPLERGRDRRGLASARSVAIAGTPLLPDMAQRALALRDRPALSLARRGRRAPRNSRRRRPARPPLASGTQVSNRRAIGESSAESKVSTQMPSSPPQGMPTPAVDPHPLRALPAQEPARAAEILEDHRHAAFPDHAGQAGAARELGMPRAPFEDVRGAEIAVDQPQLGARPPARATPPPRRHARGRRRRTTPSPPSGTAPAKIGSATPQVSPTACAAAPRMK